MTNNYAKTLVDFGLPREDIFEAARLLTESEELSAALSDPAIDMADKSRVIDSVFPESARGFVSLLTKEGHIGDIWKIISEYKALLDKKDGIIRASLMCVTDPTEEQLRGIKEFLCRRFGEKTAEVEISHDSSLIGGFILSARGVEFDRSLRSSLEDLRRKIVKSV